MEKIIYMAYGSNLDKSQMKIRCPKATSLGFILVPNHRLVFKGVADMIPAKNFSCPVGLWDITEDCETALDYYEGFPRLYRKKYFENQKTKDTYMAYVMNGNDLGNPMEKYLQGIINGYDDFGIEKKYLEEALLFTNDNRTDYGYIPKRYRSI